MIVKLKNVLLLYFTIWVNIIICAPTRRNLPSPPRLLYDFGGDIAYSRGSYFLGATVANLDNIITRNLYTLDEHYQRDAASILHNTWRRGGELQWRFDCESIKVFKQLKGSGIGHIGWNNENSTFVWVPIMEDLQFCNIMHRLIDSALREWLDPNSDRISHTPEQRQSSTFTTRVEIAFTEYNHRQSDGSLCTFDRPNVLAHANSEFVHINSNIDWCILGSKSPRYFLQVNRTGVHTIVDSIDANYGRMLTQYTRLHPVNCINLYAVLLHELGHTLGLNHAFLPSSLMYPTAGDPLNYVHASDATFLAQLFRN